MKITFLGTGTSQGIPVIGCTHEVCLSSDQRDKRLRASVLIQIGKTNLVIDCGPDFRQQILNAGISFVSAILFTHIHADHTAGLDDVRPISMNHGHLPVFARRDVIENIRERFSYMFKMENRYEGAPKIEINEITNTPFFVQGIEIQPVEVVHGEIDIFGFRIGNFAYLTDVKQVNEEEKLKLSNLDVLVVNALRQEWHPTHFNLQEALAFIDEIKPKKAYLTHISHKLGFHAEVSKILPAHVELSYDGLTLEI